MIVILKINRETQFQFKCHLKNHCTVHYCKASLAISTMNAKHEKGFGPVDLPLLC